MTPSDTSADSPSRLGPANRFGRRATDLRDGTQRGVEQNKDGDNAGADDAVKDKQASGEKHADAKDAGEDRHKDGGEDADKKGDKDSGEDGDKDQKKPSVFRKTWVRVLIAVVILLLIVAAIIWWLIARDYENTDDAFIDSHIVQVAPQIAGQITALHVTDNQLVKAGDPIAEIDAADANARVTQVEAQKAQAESQYQQARAAEAGPVAQAENAKRDLARYRLLQQSAPAAVAQQQVDQAVATERNATAQRNAALAQTAGAAKQVKVLEAQIASAQINLGYTRIVAPLAGHVTQRNVAPGSYVSPGQSMLAIVPLEFWVTANFKETQLALMRPGQSVTIKLDACGGEQARGHVDSVQRGAGQAFGILPPENATGNYVKVVQRVPVKILLDSVPQDCVLGPGMSVLPRVKVR